ncbi:MAG TPA: hypothetical protein VGN57_09430 [Pirellulaceae bacterium]|nr:hypothetical protein [Pirellulaceae bacterium]
MTERSLAPLHWPSNGNVPESLWGGSNGSGLSEQKSVGTNAPWRTMPFQVLGTAIRAAVGETWRSDKKKGCREDRDGRLRIESGLEVADGFPRL